MKSKVVWIYCFGLCAGMGTNAAQASIAHKHSHKRDFVKRASYKASHRAAVRPVSYVASKSHGAVKNKARAIALPENLLEKIQVEGNHRIETGTILSYMVLQPGDDFSRADLNRSLKALYATGLFKDVALERDDHTLIVRVVENPIVNRIVFEGNGEIKTEDLVKEVSLRPRAVYSSRTLAADRQKILNLYAQHARFGATVTPQIVTLSHNRVDVIFVINEAHETLVRKIAFVGNKFYPENALTNVVSSKEAAWYRLFSSSTQYNAQRIRYDEELLRRFYLQNGFVDFKMVDATGELATDHKSFYVTYTLHEGERYRLNKINIRSNVRHVTPELMQSHIELFPNQYYDGTAIAANATNMQDWLQSQGHPFAIVRTEIARNPEKRTVDLLFDIVEGPRVYVERLDINGNTITHDSVIRRVMPVSEGDAYTPMAKKYAKYGAQDLGYFKSVTVDQTQGSAPDRVNLTTTVVEKPTGEFSVGGGYSTDVGIMGNVSVKQHNLLGTGVDAGFSGTIAYYERQANLSFTDPYFLGRNLVAGTDLYFSQSNNMTYQSYNEGQYGFDVRAGYAFSRYLSQSWTYSLVDRQVGNINYGQISKLTAAGYDNQYISSPYVIDSRGWSLLSQLSTTMTYDRRDNRTRPHQGYFLTIGGDFAGIGGKEKYMRGKLDGAYYIPLDSIFGNHDWTVQLKGGVGYMGNWGDANSDRNIIDNFYLGGQNLRGFLQGGVGPRSGHAHCASKTGWCNAWEGQEDLLGGRFMYTASAQVNYPLPMGKALGISGRSFVDAGSLVGVRVQHLYTNPNATGTINGNPAGSGCAQGKCGDGMYTPIYGDTFIPRVSVGTGISWKSPFGLVNIDAAIPLHRERGDRLYPFRFGFGQQF